MDYVVIGRKGLGKSTCALHCARKQAPYILIWDNCCQFRIFATARNPQQLKEMLQAHDGNELFNPIAYQPIGEAHDDFPAFADAVWLCGRRPLAVIVDEASELQSPFNMETRLSRLVRQGHRYNISVIQTTHRPPDLHRRSWALGSCFLFFRTTDRRDLDRIAEHCGDDFAAQVSTLPEFHCVVWFEDEQRAETWNNPAEWFVDIHGVATQEPQQPQVSYETLKRYQAEEYSNA